MENREVIEWFENRIAVMPESETKEMFRMAISALEERERNKVPCRECKYERGGSGYYECGLHGWRVKQFDSCEDGERKK